MISVFSEYSKVATVKRFVTDANGIKTANTTTSTVDVVVRPLGSQDFAFVDGDATKSFSMYADIGADIMKSDKIEIGTEVFAVKSISLFEDSDIGHMKCIIEKIK